MRRRGFLAALGGVVAAAVGAKALPGQPDRLDMANGSSICVDDAMMRWREGPGGEIVPLSTEKPLTMAEYGRVERLA